MRLEAPRSPSKPRPQTDANGEAVGLHSLLQPKAGLSLIFLFEAASANRVCLCLTAYLSRPLSHRLHCSWLNRLKNRKGLMLLDQLIVWSTFMYAGLKSARCHRRISTQDRQRPKCAGPSSNPRCFS